MEERVDLKRGTGVVKKAKKLMSGKKEFTLDSVSNANLLPIFLLAERGGCHLYHGS